MDTIIKFVKFLCCSWTSDPPRYGNFERTITRLINEYNPQTPLGLKGINIGQDAAIIQKNLLNQVLCMCLGVAWVSGVVLNFVKIC